MNRINAIRNTAENRSVAWGKDISKNTGALLFAAVLIVCSVTVGCSSDKPKPVSSNNQIPVTPTPTPAVPAMNMQAETKPVAAPKKVGPGAVTSTAVAYPFLSRKREKRTKKSHKYNNQARTYLAALE